MELDTEVPKEKLNKAIEVIEIAKKSGKIKKGTNEVTKAVERGIAKFVLVAKDVNPREIIMHLPALCKEKQVPLVPISSKAELGALAGLGVPTSAIVVIKEGDAKELIKEFLE